MYQESLFQDGKQRKQGGMQRVTNNGLEWSERTGQKLDDWLSYVTRTRRSQFFTGDDMRNHLIGLHTPEPHHPNAWSAVMGAAVRRWLKEGKIEQVGYDVSKRPSRHSSIVRLYKIL